MAKREKGKISGLKNDGTPNTYWRKFKERLDNYDSTTIKDWKDENFLGHILKRCKEMSDGVEFPLSYSGPPTKSKEIYCIRRMVLAIGSEDPEYIKSYIDWVFDKVAIPGKVLINSIAYFFTNAFIFKFKQEYRRNNRITRASKIPEAYKRIVESTGADINTYGDLAFAKMAVDQDPENEDYSTYIKMFNLLKENGFDVDNLGKLD